MFVYGAYASERRRGDEARGGGHYARNAVPFGRAVSLYRSKFLDCPAGAVPNSYPKLDLLWDNLIAGPWGWPHSTVLAKSRPVTNPSTGRDAYRMREPTIPINELSTSGSGQFD